MQQVTVTLNEEQRQLVLLSLAELSMARPGWVNCLSEVALLMDEPDANGNPNLFEQFRRNHSNAVAAAITKGA